MGMAEFIKKKFLGQRICTSIDNGESEMLMYNDAWVNNREYFEGTVIDVEEGVLILRITDKDLIYINPEDISYFWPAGIPNPHKVLRTTLTNKPHKS